MLGPACSSWIPRQNSSVGKGEYLEQEDEMKLQTIISLLVGLGISMSPHSVGAQTASASVSSVPVTVRVMVPITLSLTNSGLAFGDVFSNVTGGNLVLNPATNVVSTTGGLTMGTVSPVNAAVFKAGGTRNASFTITLPANGAVTLTGPGTPMLLNAFTAAVGTVLLSSPFVNTLPNVTGASLSFQVGATVAIPANQVDGNYVGAFAVTVAYN
jgi:hypothetical protein